MQTSQKNYMFQNVVCKTEQNQGNRLHHMNIMKTNRTPSIQKCIIIEIKKSRTPERSWEAKHTSKVQQDAIKNKPA